MSDPCKCVTVLMILSVFVVKIDAQAQAGDIRLFDGTSHTHGRIEIYHDDAWGTICDDGWSTYDAIVACRQLGFTGSSSTRCCAAYGYSYSSANMWLTHLACNSYEDRLDECSTSYGWGPHNSRCGHYEDAGMICNEGTNAVRLFQNTTQSNFEGVVEVFVNGRWGTVCADNWDMEDAEILCKEMQYTDAEFIYNTTISSSSLQQTPIMGQVACAGSEEHLAGCNHAGWGYFWDHPQESYGTCENGIAGVKCRLVFGAEEIRLIGGGPNEGTVEIFFDEEWGTICHDHWDIKEGQVACRQMGFPGVLNVTRDSFHGEGTGSRIWLDDMDCNGNEENLAVCRHDGWGEIGQCTQSQLAGIVCLLTLEGDIRLIGSSETHSSGRLEIFHNSQWGSVCTQGWTDVESLVTCKHLGYRSVALEPETNECPDGWVGNGDFCYYKYTSTDRMTYYDSRDACVALDATLTSVLNQEEQTFLEGFVMDDGQFLWIGLHDSGTEGTWVWEDGNAFTSSSFTNWATGQPDDFGVGTGEDCVHFRDSQDGADQVGQWNDLPCNSTRYRTTGYICKKRLQDPNVPSGDVPIWLSNVACVGNETDLRDCNFRNNWGDVGQCDHSQDVVVSCSDASNKLRLVGGATSREGYVEIYHNGRWGTICPDDWDVNEVRVVCKYLGFSGEGSVRNRPILQDGNRGPTWLGGLKCVGSEGNIAECPHPGWEKNGCNYVEQAGVICHVAQEGDVRLVDDSSPTDARTHLIEGRVEIYHRGAWGTICSSGWDVHDGDVVCRQLGFIRLLETGTNALYGTGSGEAFLTDVDCAGSESSLLKCGLTGWGTHDCNETQTVTVVCSGVDSSPPVIYNCPRDMNVTVEVGGVSSPVYWLEPWAIDDTGITTLLTSSHSPGTAVKEGTTNVMYLFINAANLVAGCTFNINAEPECPQRTIAPGMPSEPFSFVMGTIKPADIFDRFDTTPPTITQCPSDIYFPTTNATSTVPVYWSEPSATDVSNATLLGSTSTPGSFFGVGSSRVSYDFTDGYNNHAFCNFTVNVIVGGSPSVFVPPSSEGDSQLPEVINCPGDLTTNVELGTQGTTVYWDEPWVSSPTGNGTLIAQTHTSGNIFPAGRTTVTYIFVDAYRQLVTCSFNVVGTSVDTTPPTIYHCNSNIIYDIRPTGSGAIVSWNEPFAIDVGGGVDVSQTHHSRTVFQPGKTTVTYNFTDTSGNMAPCAFNVSIEEDTTTAPTPGLNISNCPENIKTNIEIGTSVTRVTWLEPVANSISGNVSLVYQTHMPGDMFGVGKTPVEYVYLDDNGQVAHCRFVVTGTPVDTRPPEVMFCPRDQEVEFELGTNATIEWIEPVAFDIMGVNETRTSHVSGTIFPPGYTLVWYRFTDVTGNNSTCEFYVNVTEVDTTPPTVQNCPSDIDVQREHDPTIEDPTVKWEVPTATDLSGIVTVTSSHESGMPFHVGNTTVMYTFEDDAGNGATCEFVVNVREVDTSPPAISYCPSNVTATVELGSTGIPITWEEPNVTDTSNVTDLLLQTHASGDNFVSGKHLITYLFTDAYRNIAKCEFYIRIDTVDTKPPMISQCPDHIETTSPRPGKILWWSEPKAWDVSGNVTLEVNGDRGGPGAGFPLGLSMVHYKFTDSSQNSETCTFEVNITGPPSIQGCPSRAITRTIELGDNGKKVSWNEPSPENPKIVSLLHRTHIPDQSVFPQGKTVVSYIYYDMLTTIVDSCSFNVVLNPEDTKPPVIIQCPSDIERIATSHSGGTVVSWSEPTATDYSNYTMRRSNVPGSRFTIGTTRVTFTFTDMSSNSNTARCTFNVTIVPVETSFLEITRCPNDIKYMVELGTVDKQVTWIEPMAFDPLGHVTLLSQTHRSGQAFQVGVSAVVYEFNNDAGHAAVCNFTVEIATVDTTAPSVLGCPRDVSVNAEIGKRGKSVTWIEPQASDISETATLLARTHIPGSSFYPGQTLVTYIYSDSSHNTAACSFHINIILKDTSAPIVTSCPSNITQMLPDSASTTEVYWKSPDAIDLSGDMLSKVASHNPGDKFRKGVTQVVYEFKDSAQNSATCRFSVTMKTDSNTPPKFSCNPDVVNVAPIDSEPDCKAVWEEPWPLDDDTGLFFKTHAPGVIVPGGSSVMVTYVFRRGINLDSCTFTVKCSKVVSSQQIQPEVEFPLSITGVVIAAVIAICLIAALIFVCYRRMYKQIKPLRFNDDGPALANPEFVDFDDGTTRGPDGDTDV